MTVILLHRFDNPLLFLEQASQSFGLAVAKFQHKTAVMLEESAGLRGQTPGMRMAGVRLVALADGGVPGIGALLIRNVFRLVDSLPSFYAIGLVTTMVTKNAVRIGDIAAGTVLVYDEQPRDALLSQFSGRAVERLGLAQAQLVRELLDRWP